MAYYTLTILDLMRMHAGEDLDVTDMTAMLETAKVQYLGKSWNYLTQNIRTFSQLLLYTIIWQRKSDLRHLNFSKRT